MHATITDPKALSSEQRELIAAATRNRGGLIVCVRADTHGRAVRGKQEKFFDPHDPRVAVRYLDTLKQLERLQLLRQADKREAYELTNWGWMISRKLRPEFAGDS